jgi:murein L,D-transpeptidase YcbB/YkuD
MQLFLNILILFHFSACFAIDPSLASSTYNNATSIATKNYVALQQALAIYKNAATHPWPLLSKAGLLKPGMKSNEVMILRNRLEATGELKSHDSIALDTYDEELANAVRTFQTCHGLNPDGIVGHDTRAELNISPLQRIQQLQINMARWAKLSSELNNDYILVNVPDYKLDLVENGMTVLSMKAIIGKPTRPTPEINSTVTRIILNPYWNVPKLIAQKDIVPKILENPNYLQEMHIKVINREEDNSPEINPQEIDWQAAAEKGFQYHFRQDPGEYNALGLVKFEFQNSHDIYMHDTPAKTLFDADKRAFSSGCIRLEKPFELVNYLMENNKNWSAERMETILSEGKTSYIKLAKPIPVIITYLTAWVADDGNIQFRDDIYGWDQSQSEENSTSLS